MSRYLKWFLCATTCVFVWVVLHLRFLCFVRNEFHPSLNWSTLHRHGALTKKHSHRLNEEKKELSSMTKQQYFTRYWPAGGWQIENFAFSNMQRYIECVHRIVHWTSCIRADVCAAHNGIAAVMPSIQNWCRPFFFRAFCYCFPFSFSHYAVQLLFTSFSHICF